MKIVHVSTSETGGGAARAANRLHRGLQRLGHQSSMFVAKSMGNDSSVLRFRSPDGIWEKALPLIRRRLIQRDHRRYPSAHSLGYEKFSDDRSPYRRWLMNQLPDCDIINLHWVADFLDHPFFFDHRPPGTRVVWTLHDMNPFTGGCHYDGGCGGFAKKCGCCPQLGSNDEHDLSRKIWQRKQKTFGRIPRRSLHLVTPSRWLATEVQRSPILGHFSVSVIPNGLVTDAFSPTDRSAARFALDVPQDAKVILFAAQNVTNSRKGYSLLLETLNGLQMMPDLFLVSLGSGELPAEIPTRHLNLNFQNDRHLSLVYSAADLFVIPSLQDNLPNTVMESMACGTPTVGFDVGGVADMVRPGMNGILVPPGDARSLGEQMIALLNAPQACAEMGARSRKIALAEYSLKAQAERYVELYNQISTA